MIADTTSRAENLIAEYLRGPEQLATFLAPLGQDALAFRPDPGRWTVHESILHLADFELLLSFRLRKMLAEERPALPVMDQNAWVTRLESTGRRARRGLMDLRRLREGNIEILHGLGVTDWEREGIHPERGPIKVRELIRQGIDHLAEHLKQMQENLAAFQPAIDPARPG